MKNTRIASILISVSMTIIVFSGCNSRIKAPITKRQPIINTTRPNQSNSTAMMKTLYSKTLKDLVATKTITQNQSSKVLSAITNNMSPNTIGTTPNTVTTPNTRGTTLNTVTPENPRGTTPNTVTAPDATGTTGTTPNTVIPPNTRGTTPNTITAPDTTGTTPNTVTTPNATPIANRLSSLVKSKVITQAQANTINHKIQEAIKNNQDNK